MDRQYGIPKEVKNYSGRLRINITSKDGLEPGDNVILMLEAEYDKLLNDKQMLSSQVDMLQHERQNLEDLIEVTLNPIHQHYKEEMEKKDNIISSKNAELNSIKAVLNKFTTSLSGLSFIDVVRGKHKNLINDFHDSIWVNVPMDQVKNVDTLPGTNDEK